MVFLKRVGGLSPSCGDLWRSCFGAGLRGRVMWWFGSWRVWPDFVSTLYSSASAVVFMNSVPWGHHVVGACCGEQYGQTCFIISRLVSLPAHCCGVRGPFAGDLPEFCAFIVVRVRRDGDQSLDAVGCVASCLRRTEALRDACALATGTGPSRLLLSYVRRCRSVSSQTVAR